MHRYAYRRGAQVNAVRLPATMMPAEVPGSTSALSASALVGIAAADGADGAADGAPDAAHAAADVVSSVLRPIAHNSGITRTGERPRGTHMG